jgi:hypothetical protein
MVSHWDSLVRNPYSIHGMFSISLIFAGVWATFKVAEISLLLGSSLWVSETSERAIVEKDHA